MLKIADLGKSTSSAVIAATPRISANEFLSAVANHKETEVFEKLENGFASATPAATLTGVKPIAVPLSMSSFAPDTLARFSKYLDAMGFVAVPSGSTTSSGARPRSAAPNEFHGGDAVGAVLINGDFNVAATGTVTFVDGNRVYAFGHPFLDMGEVNFPMAKSEIVTVMPSLASSFKFANTGTVVGAVAGGLAGNALSHGGGKTGGTLLGAGLGAVAGHQIAKHNDTHVRCHWEYRD